MFMLGITHMQIITFFQSLHTHPACITIYGPSEIPPNHFLYGRKVHAHGVYTRNLILSNKLVIQIVIFRFREILPPGSKNKSITYSLLPFFISPFQRHENKTIDDALKLFFEEKKSKFAIADKLQLGIDTVRRWIERFVAKAEELNKNLEIRLSETKPGYKPAAKPICNIYDTFRSIYDSVSLLAKEKQHLVDFGVISWLNLNF